jgi:hypothetical protein
VRLEAVAYGPTTGQPSSLAVRKDGVEASTVLGIAPPLQYAILVSELVGARQRCPHIQGKGSERK